MIKRLSELNKNDAATTGGKGTSLGEMIHAGFAVPEGFVIPPQSFGKRGELKNRKEILEAFTKLNSARVAVRSSAIAEDTIKTTWAGQLETYLNVSKKQLVERIEDCWRSAKTKRAATYAKMHNLSDEGGVAVVVQAMIDSEISGVMFTVSPTSKDHKTMLIEACYGLGELLVQGEVAPETIMVDKTRNAVLGRERHAQSKYMKWEDGENKIVELEDTKKDKPILTDELIASLADLGHKLEHHYSTPQDIEWAVANGKVWLLQSRPITILQEMKQEASDVEEDAEIIVAGLAGSFGLVSGTARVVHGLEQIGEVKDGDILVAPKTTPDYVEVFAKVRGIVTDVGGATSHAAIVSRELSIPAVVNTGDATQLIKTGDLITVDGYNGKVYRGNVNVNHLLRPTVAYDIRETGNEIDDLVNAMSNVYVDVRELWPYPPINLFPYFDVDQALDTYMKLKHLVEAGMSFDEIARLFKRAEQVRYFLINTGATSLKIAHNLKIANIGIKDQVKLVEWCIEILKRLTQADPLCLEGKNLYWNQEQVDEFVARHTWQEVTPEFKRAVDKLSVNLYSMNWSFYWNYYGAAGYDIHGPYKSKELGGTSQLVIKDYFNPAPTELWPLAREVPFRSAMLAQVYDNIDIKISFGNRILNQGELAKSNSRFVFLLDGKQVTDIQTMRTIAEKAAEITRAQTQYVSSLPIMDVARKCAQLAFYIHKDFYLHFGKDWYPEQTIEKTIEILGDKFTNAKPPIEDRTLELTKQMLDPRNYITP